MEPATAESTDSGSRIGAGAGVQRDVRETVSTCTEVVRHSG